jgi:hypothetical protein
MKRFLVAIIIVVVCGVGGVVSAGDITLTTPDSVDAITLDEINIDYNTMKASVSYSKGYNDIGFVVTKRFTIAKAMVDVDWANETVDGGLGYKWKLIPCTY